jgi:hypothetical protein
MRKKSNNLKNVLAISLIVLISFFAGFYFGEYTTIKAITKIGIKLMEMQKINISIDENMIVQGILQYKQNIAGCVFMK